MNSLNNQLDLVKTMVNDLLGQDQTGHDMTHIERVLNLSLKFAQQENADPTLTALIALLHDVDDRKLFVKKSATELPNAMHIMEKTRINPDTQNIVLSELKQIGYSKRLQGIHPQTLEGKIVSDADMCDTLGATGILRAYQYSMAHGRPFFRQDILPNSHIDAQTYTSYSQRDTGINHFFEKLLHLKTLMLTNSGKHESETRHDFIVSFLRHFFQEENAISWEQYLDDFLAQQETSD